MLNNDDLEFINELKRQLNKCNEILKHRRANCSRLLAFTIRLSKTIIELEKGV